MIRWRIDSSGPDGLIIRFGDDIDLARVSIVRAATERLSKALQGRRKEIRDLIPSYSTVTVCYDPVQNDFASMSQKIRQLLVGLEDENKKDVGRLIEIPVYYDLEVGPDLARVAQRHNMDVEEVILRHTQQDYDVFAIGFAPGFAYLGTVDDAIATPRLATPRARVPAGAVALADRQTAVYPIATPGGWNILGRTAVKMFDPQQEGLCPVTTGDRVRFVSVSREQFIAAGGDLQ